MKKLFTLAACLTATALLQSQTTIFVTPNGSGDGTSWATACDLEEAIPVIERSRNDLATEPGASAPLSDPIEIWVQSGTYYPSKMLVIPASVKVYGGFAGSENNLSERDFSANVTVIGAQHKFGSVFRLGNSSELNGLTIQNGNANGSPHKNGGGVWADDNAIIANCIIQNNAAIADGGGIYAKGNLTLISSTVENNTANNGADLYGNCITQISVPVVVATGCNSGTFDFGAVHFETSTEYTITGTVDGQPLTQIWSDAVWTDNCQKTAFAGGSPSNYNVDCRSNPSYSGDLFSWCAVARYAYILCPEPWRVPTLTDFINLDKALGGTGVNRPQAAMLPKYIGDGSSWGGAYGGYCNSSGSVSGQGSHAFYWSQTELSSDYGYFLYLISSGGGGYINPQYFDDKLYCFTLRCVR